MDEQGNLDPAPGEAPVNNAPPPRRPHTQRRAELLDTRLVHVGKGPLPVIFNRVTRMALIIDEDDELYASVVQQMIDHGKEVLKELPLARVPVACQNRAEPADIER